MTINLAFYAWLRLEDGWVPRYTHADRQFASSERTRGALHH